MLVFAHFAGDPVVLYVRDADFTLLEPDSGMNATVTFCFDARIARPLFTDVTYHVHMTEGMATEDEDFVTASSPYIVIRSGFNGTFSQCFSVVIIGDDEVEEDEMAVFSIMAADTRNSASPDTFTITILDFDGEYCTSKHIGQLNSL